MHSAVGDMMRGRRRLGEAGMGSDGGDDRDGSLGD